MEMHAYHAKEVLCNATLAQLTTLSFGQQEVGSTLTKGLARYWPAPGCTSSNTGLSTADDAWRCMHIIPRRCYAMPHSPNSQLSALGNRKWAAHSQKDWPATGPLLAAPAQTQASSLLMMHGDACISCQGGAMQCHTRPTHNSQLWATGSGQHTHKRTGPLLARSWLHQLKHRPQHCS